RRIADAIVRGEIIRRFRRSARFQIGRARASHTVYLSDTYRDQVAVGEIADAKRDIDVLVQEVDHPVLQIELNVDLGVRRQKLHQDRLETSTAERGGGRACGGFAGRC